MFICADTGKHFFSFRLSVFNAKVNGWPVCLFPFHMFSLLRTPVSCSVLSCDWSNSDLAPSSHLHCCCPSFSPPSTFMWYTPSDTSSSGHFCEHIIHWIKHTALRCKHFERETSSQLIWVIPKRYDPWILLSRLKKFLLFFRIQRPRVSQAL